MKKPKRVCFCKNVQFIYDENTKLHQTVRELNTKLNALKIAVNEVYNG